MNVTTVDALKDLLVASGAGWVLWLLLALSLASVAIAIERFVVLRRTGGDLDALVRTLDLHLGGGDHAAALEALGGSACVGARVASVGLRLAHRGARAAEKAMESATALERRSLEARLAFLGTLGNNAPFIGLFGTVIGVILAFEALGRGDVEAAAGAPQVASAAVMGAIAEALVATAVGIGVALPAVALHNYFHRRVADIVTEVEALAGLVAAHLEEPRGAGGGA